jgi:hypothetical protein
MMLGLISMMLGVKPMMLGVTPLMLGFISMMLGLISMMLGVTHDAWINFHDVHCIIIYSMVLMSVMFLYYW